MKKYILFFLLITRISLAQITDFNNINFQKADNIAQLHMGENLYNLPLLTYKLTSKLTTDVEKFRAIYKWVCNNIRGDFKQHRQVSKNREKFKNNPTSYILWNNQYKKKAFEKLRRHKKTMCTGYAYLIKEMCFLAGIRSIIIEGYGRTVSSNIDSLEILNHSWNAVKLNKKWYLCDATWSSGYMDERNNFVKEYNDGYFLTKPELFSKNHFPKNKKWLLNSKISKEEFVSQPLLYNEAFKYKVSPLSPTKMKLKVAKLKDIDFKFKILEKIDLNSISLIYFAGNSEKKLAIDNIKKQNDIVRFNCKFMWKGVYDIHLKINNDVLMTYSIEVVQ